MRRILYCARRFIGLFTVAGLLLSSPGFGKSKSDDDLDTKAAGLPDVSGTEVSSPAIALSESTIAKGFRWKAAARDSAKFLLLQNLARFTIQKKTRQGLSGPFLPDYMQTLKASPNGFMDGDPWFTNFIGHPIQGAASYHLARFQGASRRQAFWWGVAYSGNFELGPLGEAGIGNVRISPVDLIVTPTAGFVLGTTEEWIASKLSGSNRKLVRAARFALAGRTLSRIVSSGRTSW